MFAFARQVVPLLTGARLVVLTRIVRISPAEREQGRGLATWFHGAKLRGEEHDPSMVRYVPKKWLTDWQQSGLLQVHWQSV